MCVLTKIYKRLYNTPGRPVISKFGTRTEKKSEFLDHHLQPVMKSGRLVMKLGKYYVQDTADFLEKIKILGRIPIDAFLVTAHVVGLYHSIPHVVGLKALYEKLEERTDKKVPSADLVDMTEFVLKNSYLICTLNLI